MPAKLLLASSSKYRRELLSRLRIDFDTCTPQVDETPQAGESGPDLARRLARAKALALTTSFPEHVIIGSDQVVVCRGKLLGKPGNFDRAAEQLRLCSAQPVEFHTAVHVHDPATGHGHCELVSVISVFRDLGESEICAYLKSDEPYDCAGALRVEGLGISLLESMQCPDPTAIIGLPLIALGRILRLLGY